jgi:hypothetical protein
MSIGHWLRGGLLVLALAGCGGGETALPDAAPPPPDAAPPQTVHESREVVSGGGRLTAGSLTVDVEVGHGVGQQQMNGGSFTVEGAASVKRKPQQQPQEMERKVAQ